MDVGIGKITSDQFMLTGMYVCIKLRTDHIHIDRDVGIDKITTDLFMLTGM